MRISKFWGALGAGALCGLAWVCGEGQGEAWPAVASLEPVRLEWSVDEFTVLGGRRETHSVKGALRGGETLVVFLEPRPGHEARGGWVQVHACDRLGRPTRVLTGATLEGAVELRGGFVVEREGRRAYALVGTLGRAGSFVETWRQAPGGDLERGASAWAEQGRTRWSLRRESGEWALVPLSPSAAPAWRLEGGRDRDGVVHLGL